MLRRTLPLTFVLLAVVFGACVPPVEEVELARDYGPATEMGLVQERGELVAGVAADLPPGTDLGGDGPGALEGFVVDLAGAVADTLDVPLKVEHAPSEDLLEMVEAGELDIAFPLIPVTEKLARRAGPTDPYIVAHQRLLVPAGSGVTEVADLTTDDVVCPLRQAGIRVALPSLHPSAKAIRPNDAAGCMAALEKGRAAVITGPELELIGIQQALGDLTITGEALTTAGYSIVVRRDTGSWRGFIEGVLGRYKSGGHWLVAYNRWLAPYLGREAEPPRMTVEEAAALYPRDL
jgi:polar amino acid transport system substrate-binding protein